jgi:metal-responsive CopG/Arc/MetJ family transcriptional regulator
MRNTPKDDPFERTSVTLYRSLVRLLDVEAEVTGRSASAIVRDALQEYFARQEPEPLPSFVGIGASGFTDTSARAEELVAEVVEERHPRKRRRVATRRR